MRAPVPGTVVESVIQQSSDVLIATHAAEELAEQAGFSSVECAEICLAVRELATNILKHAGEGVVVVGWSGERLDVDAVDAGPGIVDVERAVTDGYSTAGSLGYGLGTVNRLMDAMDITSVRGRGTTVHAHRALRTSGPGRGRSPLDIGVATIPKPGYVDNGDAFVVRTNGSRTLVGVIDGVGHGAPAQVAAQAARRYVESHAEQPLDSVFRGTGVACRGSRGVVMALARLDWASWTLEFASVGNIESRVLGVSSPINFVVRRGIIGVNAPPAKVTQHSWSTDAVLVLHSDGVATHWGRDALAGWEESSASELARHILSAYGRETDDATVLVLRRAPS